jgi:hypothetical protein
MKLFSVFLVVVSLAVVSIPSAVVADDLNEIIAVANAKGIIPSKYRHNKVRRRAQGTKAPATTNIPTKAPATAVNCEDDPTFRKGKGKGRNCRKYLKKNASKKCKNKLKKVLVSKYCPSFCNPACKDPIVDPACEDTSAKLKLVSVNGRFKCKKIKRKKLCDEEVKGKGKDKVIQLVKELCPESCDLDTC